MSSVKIANIVMAGTIGVILKGIEEPQPPVGSIFANGALVTSVYSVVSNMFPGASPPIPYTQTPDAWRFYTDICVAADLVEIGKEVLKYSCRRTTDGQRNNAWKEGAKKIAKMVVFQGGCFLAVSLLNIADHYFSQIEQKEGSRFY